MVLAVASGTDTPQQMRTAGAATVLFDLNFNKRVGTTSNPADPSLIEARAKTFFDYAVSVTGCQTPMIAENELLRRTDADAVVGDERAVPQQRPAVPDRPRESRRAAADLDREPAVHRE